MSSLPASMKKFQSKMKVLECLQHFPHYNPMGAVFVSSNPHPNNSSDKIWLNSVCWLRRYSCLCEQTNRQTNRLTDRRRLDGYTISSLCEPSAQVS